MKHSKLTKQSIKGFQNFPHLPKTIGNQELQNQDKTLSQIFTLGCKNICENLYFNAYDEVYSLNHNDMVNICISIKYGIAHCDQQKFKAILKKYKHCEEKNLSLYLKLNMKNYQDDYRTIALAKVIGINPEMTFRFWHENNCFVGVIMLDICAVGEIRENRMGLKDTYYSLKQSRLEWKHFSDADEYEWNRRRVYIEGMEDESIMQKQAKIIEKNRDFLDELKSSDY